MKYVFQIMVTIILGFLVSFLNALYVIGFGLPDILYSPLIFGALYEESLKLLLFVGLYKIKIHPYAIAFASVGYGFFEQYVPVAYGQDPSLVTMWMHISAGVIMAIMLKKAIDKKSSKIIYLADQFL